MNFLIDESSTRKNILFLIKKNGNMSIDGLSKVIDITPMGIRQHLIALEKKGLVKYASVKKGIGRPGFIYSLTETAHDLFPYSYDKLAIDILRNIRKYEGDEKVEKIFGWRKDKILNTSRNALAGMETLGDKVNGLKDILESEGHFVEVSEGAENYHLNQYHCPISRVSVEFRDACNSELQLYRELLGREVKRVQAISEGANSCLYMIPWQSLH
jgi:predicted ArsR family transcriptional regulator